MADNASRRGATNLGTPLMILAFATIAGFMYWLNGQASYEMAAREAYADSVAAAEEFLISVPADAEIEGGEVATGSDVWLTGRVMAINDSVLNAWTEAGTIGDGDRLAAEFATYFIEVLQLRVAPGGNDEGQSEG